MRGSVVDLRFETHLSSIYRVLRAGSKGQIPMNCWRSWRPGMRAGSP